jgi:hypothetical protein
MRRHLAGLAWRGSYAENGIAAIRVADGQRSRAMEVHCDDSNSDLNTTRNCEGSLEYGELHPLLNSLQMPARRGTKQDPNSRNRNTLGWLSVTVAEGAD